MPKLIDLTGEQFGRLVVLRYAGKNNNGRTQWLCKCNCENEKIIVGYHLKSGDTKSCGCLRVEKTIKRLTKHGHSTRAKTSKTYRSWYSIIQRCTNPNNKDYHSYGGRGITICKRWMKFENFLKDMGEMPKGHQIDRVNNDKGYCRSNCRLVTSKINNRNKRNNHLITYKGKTQCMSAWAEELNINKATLWYRVYYGWSIEKTLTTPVRKRGESS